MIFSMNRMEKHYLQLLTQQRHFADDKDSRDADPYLSGPVKNTILRHSKEVLGCYQEFLERDKAIAGLKPEKIAP